MQERFFWMYPGNNSRCYWAEIVSDLPDSEFRNGMRGFKGVISLSITKGGIPCDFLGTNSGCIYIASERVLTLLEKHGITGYETYDVEVSGGDVELPKYYGLVAVGRGGTSWPRNPA